MILVFLYFLFDDVAAKGDTRHLTTPAGRRLACDPLARRNLPLVELPAGKMRRPVGPGQVEGAGTAYEDRATA